MDCFADRIKPAMVRFEGVTCLGSTCKMRIPGSKVLLPSSMSCEVRGYHALPKVTALAIPTLVKVTFQ